MFRVIRLTLFCLGVLALTAYGQSPAPVTPDAAKRKADAEEYLNAYLTAWEKRMSSLGSLVTKVELTEMAIEEGKGKVRQRVDTTYSGDARILKPNFASLLLKENLDPKNEKRWKHFAADGKHLWEFSYGPKVARLNKLPENGLGENTLLAFLFGMKVADVKKRYDLSMDPWDRTKLNEWYAHITILPKLDADKQEFAKAELVLYKHKDHPNLMLLPARLWFQHPNGNEVTWQFKQPVADQKLDSKEFQITKFPTAGEWRSEWAEQPKMPKSTIQPTGGRGSEGTGTGGTGK